jgi:hypothetical protein
MTTETKTLSVRQAQARASKKATLDLLRGKKRRRKELSFNFNGEQVTLVFEAISSKELDTLQASCPPTKDQQGRGLSFNPEKFTPALVAACMVDPDLSVEDAQEIWVSDEWSSGELATLFTTAWELVMEGLDIPFTGSDSERTTDSD